MLGYNTLNKKKTNPKSMLIQISKYICKGDKEKYLTFRYVMDVNIPDFMSQYRVYPALGQGQVLHQCHLTDTAPRLVRYIPVVNGTEQEELFHAGAGLLQASDVRSVVKEIDTGYVTQLFHASQFVEVAVDHDFGLYLIESREHVPEGALHVGGGYRVGIGHRRGTVIQGDHNRGKDQYEGNKGCNDVGQRPSGNCPPLETVCSLCHTPILSCFAQ